VRLYNCRMPLVIDTSTVISVIGNEPARGRILAATQGDDLIAPASLPWEIGNAFAAMFKQRRTTLEKAIEALHAYAMIPIDLVPVSIELALELAAELGIYAYDAYMIACSLERRSPLLATDAGLRRAALRVGAEVLEV
jgi:predicted nucleic acid-binding protein